MSAALGLIPSTQKQTKATTTKREKKIQMEEDLRKKEPIVLLLTRESDWSQTGV
jgi:riboflavin synthase alpha subunit